MTHNQSLVATETQASAQEASPAVQPDEDLPPLPLPDREEIASLEMGNNSHSRKRTSAEHNKTPIIGNNLRSMDNVEAESHDTDSSPSEFLPYRIVACFAKDVMKDEEVEVEGTSQSVRRLIEHAQLLEEFIDKIKVADDATVDRLEEHKASGKWNPKWEIQRMGDTALNYNAQLQPNFPTGLPNVAGNPGIHPYSQYNWYPQSFHVQIPTLSHHGPVAPYAAANMDANTARDGSEDALQANDGTDPRKKRGRGRPPKSNVVPKSLQPLPQNQLIMNEAGGPFDTATIDTLSKRRPGRPPSKRISGNANQTLEEGANDTHMTKKSRMEMASDLKRPLARGSQTTTPDEALKPVKRGRGRPRKTLP